MQATAWTQEVKWGEELIEIEETVEV